jgi:hypothetical protein
MASPARSAARERDGSCAQFIELRAGVAADDHPAAIEWRAGAA